MKEGTKRVFFFYHRVSRRETPASDQVRFAGSVAMATDVELKLPVLSATSLG